MASSYPSAAGGNIGTLLRLIQEERNEGPLAQPPATDPSSPIRNLVQQSLQQVEAPDSSRNIVVRPEVAPASAGGEGISTVVPPVPVDIVEPVPPVSPVSASAPVNTPNQSSPSASTPVSQSLPQRPSLATSIRPSSAPSVLGAKAAPAPQRPSLNLTPVAKAPSAQLRAPTQTRVGPLIVQDILRNVSGLANSLNPFASSKKAIATSTGRKG